MSWPSRGSISAPPARTTAERRQLTVMFVDLVGLTEARYTFKHALVRDAAYESLLKSRLGKKLQQRIEASNERWNEPETH